MLLSGWGAPASQATLDFVACLHPVKSRGHSRVASTACRRARRSPPYRAPTVPPSTRRAREKAALSREPEAGKCKFPPRRRKHIHTFQRSLKPTPKHSQDAEGPSCPKSNTTASPLRSLRSAEGQSHANEDDLVTRVIQR